MYFIRRFTSNYYEGGLGFKITYESTTVVPQMTYRIGECGGSFTTPNGILTSPLYPDYYPKDADCVYTISQSNSTYLTLTIHEFELYDLYEQTMGQLGTEGLDCHDYLELREGNSAESPLIGKLCAADKNIPTFIPSSQSKIWMR